MARRVFWLGMHKILTRTELPRLRQLGFEVFNPPYLSDIYDQSANLDWDRRQPTTLPSEVFGHLSKYNFFYNSIDPATAELLNAYFDAVIVTINPDWLAAVVRVFKKRIIYRTYGQTYQLSAHIAGSRSWTSVIENSDFHFVPFAEETVISEHKWLTDRSVTVPYCLPEDIYGYEGTWEQWSHNDEIMVSVPNIDHPYYAGMYGHLKVHFPGTHLRLYGVQARKVDDIRIVGTIPRKELLHSYQRAAGYFYPYHDRNVCYLPPIEMMTIGGPVIYTHGSLLQRMLKGNYPGMLRGLDAQRLGIERLRRRDRAYTQEIIASQKEIVRRYHPSYVYTIFDDVFRRLLDEPGQQTSFVSEDHVTRLRGNITERRRSVWLLCHWPGHMIHEDVETGTLYAMDGISRVITKVIGALLEQTGYPLVLTCYARQAPVMASYYYEFLAGGRVSLYVLDPQNLAPVPELGQREMSWPEITRFLFRRQYKPGTNEDSLAAAAADHCAGRVELARNINASEDIAAVFVPHYYHFPEALRIERNIVFYVPDYMPYFYPGVIFEGTKERDEENAEVGRRIADKALVVLTNSEFTRSYLPQSVLEAGEEKIRVTPMPLLNGPLQSISMNERLDMETALANRPFLLYPTANRPNKELSFLLEIFNEIRQDWPELALVLTCSLSDYGPVEETAQRLNLRSDASPSERELVMFTGTSERSLRWLYENAVALCFTSTMEGNFPPQIIEALHYDTPIVATGLPQIMEVLQEDAEYLHLCSPKNIRDFIVGIQMMRRHRELMLGRQMHARRRVFSWNHIARFNRMAANLFHEAAAQELIPEDTRPVQTYDDRFLPFGLLARVKKTLGEAGSDYEFAFLMHDLVLKRATDLRTATDYVRQLQTGISREQLLADVLTSPRFYWVDAGEVEYVTEWLTRKTEGRPAAAVFASGQ